MKLYKYILTFIFVLTFGTVSAHKDFWTIRDFGNVKVRILTGFEYEEINKVLLFGQLAEQLSKQLNYSKPIFLDFRHHYTGNCESDYFISYDKGKIQYSWDAGNKETDFLKVESIVLRQIDRNFDARTTLKLLEYAILNIESIKSSQNEIEYNKNYCQWKINSIDTNLIKNVLNRPISPQIDKVLGLKFERPEKDFKYGISYYLKDNKYTVFHRDLQDQESNLITFNNFYDLKKIDGSCMMIFDTDSSFYFIDTYYKKKVSKRHIIQNTNDYYRPYTIQDIGGNKLTIYLWFESSEIGKPRKERILIYLTDKDELIQDLDKLIEKK